MLKDRIKTLCHDLLRRAGLEVSFAKNANVESVMLKNLLHASGADIVLDVGANTGQFGDMLFREGFLGTVISFEALPDVHAILRQRAKRIAPTNWRVASCVALGSANGTLEMNIAGNSVSSSILPMMTAHEDAAPLSRYVRKEVVQVRRLDEIAMDYLPCDGCILIKIDTQGYELEVLKGATQLLGRTVALQLELSLVKLYAGAPSFVEAVSFANSLGYELFGIVPGFRDKRNGRLLQVDGFFMRCEPPTPDRQQR